MARFATVAAGIALMLAQPVTTAFAQSSETAQTDSEQRRADGGTPFFSGRPDRIGLALGALAAVILGLATIGKNKNNNNGPRPTSP